MQNPRPPEGYWHILALQFRKNRIAMAGLGVIFALFAVALGADFIANDKPLVMKYQGQVYFPVLKDYAVRLGIARWESQFQNVSFKEFAKDNFKDGDWFQS